jgi:hypothetical protein
MRHAVAREALGDLLPQRRETFARAVRERAALARAEHVLHAAPEGLDRHEVRRRLHRLQVDRVAGRDRPREPVEAVERAALEPP